MSCVDAAIIKALAEHIGTVNDSDESSTVFNTISSLCRKEVPHEWGRTEHNLIKFKLIPGLDYYGMILKLGGIEILVTGFDPETCDFEHKVLGFTLNAKPIINISREDAEWYSISIYNSNDGTMGNPDIPETGNISLYGWSRYECDGKPTPYVSHIHFLHRDLDEFMINFASLYHYNHPSS